MSPPGGAISRRVRRSGRGGAESLSTSMLDIRADYQAAKASRFKRRRLGLGGSADAHYQSETDFFKIIEEVRDMERNEFIVGRLLDLAVEHEQLSGPQVDPDTGDQQLDDELRDRFNDWAGDPGECDVQGRFNLNQQLDLVSRSYKRDGDIAANLIDNGQIELLEADRLRTPTYQRKRSIVHGVEIDKFRRPLRYWFTKDAGMTHQLKMGDMSAIDARDEDGYPQVLHVSNPYRVTQTRGVTPFSRIFERAGMGEDLEFANLVKQQACSAFAVAIAQAEAEMGRDIQIGERDSSTRGDGTTEYTETIGVGTVLRLNAGEELRGFAPNVPGDNFFPHMKLILQEIGVTIGLPLVMLLMDAGETNFSGYRGAMEQARQFARRTRIKVIQPQFLIPAYEWRIRAMMADDAAIRSAAGRSNVRIFRHKWKWPGWPYIQPKDDAEADAVRRDNLLASPRQIQADQGRDIADVRREIVEDNVATITAALEGAASINEEHAEAGVTWRDVLFLQSGSAAKPGRPSAGDPNRASQQTTDEGASNA